MPLTVTTVLLAARDAHPTFRPELHPDSLLVRFLDRFQDQVASEIAQTRRTAVARSFMVPIAGHDFEEGDAISAYLPGERPPLVIAGAMIRGDVPSSRRQPVPVVEHPGAAERINGLGVLWYRDRLRLIGGRFPWGGLESVEIQYFPQPAHITSLSSEIDLPGSPAQVMEAAAADFMGTRSAPDAGVDKRDLRERLGTAIESYLDEVTGRRRAMADTIREAWP
jgi:hypothetical protein